MDTTMDTTSRNKTQKVMLKNIGLRLDLCDKTNTIIPYQGFFARFNFGL